MFEKKGGQSSMDRGPRKRAQDILCATLEPIRCNTNTPCALTCGKGAGAQVFHRCQRGRIDVTWLHSFRERMFEKKGGQSSMDRGPRKRAQDILCGTLEPIRRNTNTPCALTCGKGAGAQVFHRCQRGRIDVTSLGHVTQCCKL